MVLNWVLTHTAAKPNLSGVRSLRQPAALKFVLAYVVCLRGMLGAHQSVGCQVVEAHRALLRNPLSGGSRNLAARFKQSERWAVLEPGHEQRQT